MANKTVQRVLDQKAAEHKEDVAKWKKDHPLREPGHSLKTYKSYSRIRKPSEEFRNGFDQITWSGGSNGHSKENIEDAANDS